VLRKYGDCLPALDAADRRLLVARAGMSDRDALSLTALSRRLHISRGAVRSRVVLATRRLRALGGGTCGSPRVATSLAVGGSQAGPLTGAGAARLMGVATGRRAGTGVESLGTFATHHRSSLARPFRSLAGKTANSWLAILAFVVACLALVGIKLAVRQRAHGTGPFGRFG